MERLKSINPNHAVSFSGHRPERLPGYGDPNRSETQACIKALREKIEDAVLRGKTIFIQGGMSGFDILCGEQVIYLKVKHPNIQLITIAPYKTCFFTREKCWTPDWISRAKTVFRQHDLGVKVADEYRSGIYYERNRALVDNSSELICYWDGGKGGSKYTVDFAISHNKQVYNIFNMI